MMSATSPLSKEDPANQEEADYGFRDQYTQGELRDMDIGEYESRTCGIEDLVNSDGELPGHECG